MEEKNKETANVRIGKRLIDYIEFIQKRFFEEYKINVAFTEASNLLVDRAEKNNLF